MKSFLAISDLSLKVKTAYDEMVLKEMNATDDNYQH